MKLIPFILCFFSLLFAKAESDSKTIPLELPDFSLLKNKKANAGSKKGVQVYVNCTLPDGTRVDNEDIRYGDCINNTPSGPGYHPRKETPKMDLLIGI